ncbi:MAG: SCO family protein [Planctomycetota bacterium]
MRLIATILVFICTLAAAVCPAVASAQQLLPDVRAGVGIDERLNAQVPLDLEFSDEHGNHVALSKFFKGSRPVILTLNYAGCPMLCGKQLNGLVDVLKEMKMTPGVEFELITISIDPKETPADAQRKKREFVKRMGKPAAASGWHFLTGSKSRIKRLADSVGFGFKFDKESDEFIHVAAFMVLTPDGKISRYVYGVLFPERTMRFTLIEASGGRVGDAFDKVLFYCFLGYDPDSNSYAPVAMKIMRTGGMITLLGLGTFLSILWWRERKRRVQNSGVAA